MYTNSIFFQNVHNMAIIWFGDQCLHLRYSPLRYVYNNLNSPPPSSAPYVRLWTRSALDKVMACRLLGAKPLPQPTMTFCQLNPEDPTPMKSESKCKIFIHENESENVVCEMTAIVSRSHCVNILFYLCPSNSLRLPSMVVSCWGGSWEIMGICGKHRCVEYPLYHTHQRMLWFIGETSCDQEIPH